jgi:hypothetical protein
MVLIAYGDDDADRLLSSGLDGKFIRLRPGQAWQQMWSHPFVREDDPIALTSTQSESN